MSNKTKKWTILNGEIVPASIFGLDSLIIEAKTKGEAQQKALQQLAAIQYFGGPILVVKNGAFLLLSHTGQHILAESGDLSRHGESGKVHPLCTAHHANISNALMDPSFAYYSSEDYQSQKGK